MHLQLQLCPESCFGKLGSSERLCCCLSVWSLANFLTVHSIIFPQYELKPGLHHFKTGCLINILGGNTVSKPLQRSGMESMLTYKVVTKQFLMLKFLLNVPDKNHIKMEGIVDWP